MKNKFLQLFFLSIFYCYANASNNQIKPGVYSELKKFTFGQQSLPPEYIQSFPGVIHKLILDEEKKYQALSQATGASHCQQKIKTDYVRNISASQNAIIQNFEAGFIKIEVTLCFENADADNLLSILLDPEFQKTAVSTIQDSYRSGKLICEKTDAFSIGRSHYCYAPITQFTPEYSSFFHFNVWNDPSPVFDAPVYFREIFASTKKQGTITRLHMLTYVRGPALNFVQKAFAKGAIEKEQKSVYEQLKKRIKK